MCPIKESKSPNSVCLGQRRTRVFVSSDDGSDAALTSGINLLGSIYAASQAPSSPPLMSNIRSVQRQIFTKNPPSRRNG